MKINEIATAIGNAMTYLLAFMQTNETLQIIEFVLAIATSVVLLCYRLWRWYKEASKDGKITKEEIKDGIDIMANGVDDIKKKIEKGDKTDEN